MPNAIFTTKNYVDDRVIPNIYLGNLNQTSGTLSDDVMTKLDDIADKICSFRYYDGNTYFNSLNFHFDFPTNKYTILFTSETNNLSVMEINGISGAYTISNFLSTTQLAALNSGINSTKVATYDSYETNKQNTLVSGTNIKTINGQSILGSGNIEISSFEIPSIDITSLLGGQPLTPEQLEIIKNNNIIRFYTDSVGYDFTATKVINPVMKLINPNAVSFSFINDALEAELDTFTIDISTGTFDGRVRKIAQDINIVAGENLQLYTGDSHIGSGVSKSQMQSWLNSQEKLISGTNIKTINNQSLLGSGNITIGGGTNINVVDLGDLQESGGTLTLELTNQLFALAGTPVMLIGIFEGSMPFTTSNIMSTSSTLHILLFTNGSASATMELTRSSGEYTITIKGA